jgi:hypothetical protein
VRERGGVQSLQDCLGLPPILCVQVLQDKGNMREGGGLAG